MELRKRVVRAEPYKVWIDEHTQSDGHEIGHVAVVSLQSHIGRAQKGNRIRFSRLSPQSSVRLLVLNVYVSKED